jgi:homopolymeric O-antigen transport system ATP-binding protein
MIEDIAISVKNITKTYKLYDTHADRVKEAFHPLRKKYHNPFNALTDVSFDVNRGETLGIIGRNGSGKSTLLQIICGILQPSSGNVEVDGKVSALLELGAGFNPEFTGRQNVYINGSILGLTHEEIENRFDEIAAFADIGEFIDQAVKSYSSGMYVRLAFAVAISVNPDILIIDEALSVGDINFRNKCMKRIRTLKDSGVTILFVSHDLGTVQTVCDKGIWLAEGDIRNEGSAVSVCQEYYSFMTGDKSQHKSDVIIQQSSDLASFSSISIESWNFHNNIPVFENGENITFHFELQAKEPLERVVFATSIYREDGDWLIGQTSREAGVVWETCNSLLRGKLVFEPNILAPGNYYAAFAAYSEDFAICYALTDLTTPFCVRMNYPIWGKVNAPCRWVVLHD